MWRFKGVCNGCNMKKWPKTQNVTQIVTSKNGYFTWFLLYYYYICNNVTIKFKFYKKNVFYIYNIESFFFEKKCYTRK